MLSVITSLIGAHACGKVLNGLNGILGRSSVAKKIDNGLKSFETCLASEHVLKGKSFNSMDHLRSARADVFSEITSVLGLKSGEIKNFSLEECPNGIQVQCNGTSVFAQRGTPLFELAQNFNYLNHLEDHCLKSNIVNPSAFLRA